MSRKILFFINPVSGTKSKIFLEKKIAKKCGEKNVSFEISLTSKEGDYFFLRDKIERDGITDIAICGGDGSIRQIVSAILNTQVHIGIVPVGSGNGLAKTAKIPKSVDRALEVILAGKTHLTDLFLINDNLSVHVCGLGFDALVAYEFSKLKKRGLNSYTKVALKNFSSAQTYPFTIETENNSFSLDAFLICMANSNQFGNNFKVAPKASICDGLADIVIVKKTSKPQAVLAFIHQIFLGRIRRPGTKNFHKKNILYFQSKQFKIVNPQLAPLHIDGDPAETAKEISVVIIPSAYKLIYP